MSQPLVSVKMITYNHEPYIRKAIESIVMQKTDFSFELVIGEDCSTDGTREIVFDYQKKYPDLIRLVTSDNNVGMHKNSIRTINACRGKYIAFCEGDDFWHNPEKIQKQVQYLEDNPECGLVHSDQNRVFVEYGLEIESFFKTTNNTPPENFNIFRGWNGYNILTCTVMLRKKLYDAIILDSHIYNNDEYIGGFDIPLFIEISMRSTIHYFDESMSTYNVLVESASNTRDYAKKARFVVSVLECYLYLAQKYSMEHEIEYLSDRCAKATLHLAFQDRNVELARNVKDKLPASLKNRMLYLSTQSNILWFLLIVIMNVKLRYSKWRFFCFVKKFCNC